MQRALLVKKQEAERALHPPRRSPEPAKEAEPDHIEDSGLRAIYERSKAQEAEHEPVNKAARNGSYAHGSSLKLTIEKVCGASRRFIESKVYSDDSVGALAAR